MREPAAFVLATTMLLGPACSNKKQAAQEMPAQPMGSARSPVDASAAEATAPPADATSVVTVLGFDSDREGQPPSGMAFARSGGGALGSWVVRGEADAPSAPNVLAQTDPDKTNMRFPIAVTDQQLGDVRVSARCKLISGKVDQACGLVVRYRDENNYYVTRANALENNVRLYHLEAGKRTQLASWEGPVKAGVWHEYALEIRGDHIQVFWNGTRVLDHRDTTFAEPGQVGVWTKADSVTYYDDLKIEAL